MSVTAADGGVVWYLLDGIHLVPVWCQCAQQLAPKQPSLACLYRQSESYDTPQTAGSRWPSSPWPTKFPLLVLNLYVPGFWCTEHHSGVIHNSWDPLVTARDCWATETTCLLWLVDVLSVTVKAVSNHMIYSVCVLANTDYPVPCNWFVSLGRQLNGCR